MPLPDAPWTGMQPDDYRESLQPPERDWDAECDQERDAEFNDENNNQNQTENGKESRP